MMAFSAAIEPLRSANRMSERQLFEWRLVSVDGNEVTASNGIGIAVHRVPGRADTRPTCSWCARVSSRRSSGAVMGFIISLRRLARHGSVVGAISTGSFILAEAGLLAGRRCTVHWEYADSFRSRYPALAVSQDLYVVDRDVFTCSGRHGGARHDAAFRQRGVGARRSPQRSPSSSSIRKSAGRRTINASRCTHATASTVRNW